MAHDMGKKIKERRELLGLTQEELAKRLGYKGKSSINKIELGLSDVPRAKVPAFASALGMTPQELTGWTDEHAQASFSYCLEQQMRVLGYEVVYDEEGNVVLISPEKETQISSKAIKELEARLAFYLKVALAELEKGEEND